jgi:hypothetical protein
MNYAPQGNDETIKVELSDGTIVLMDYTNKEGYDGEVSAQTLVYAAEKTFGVIKGLAADIKTQIAAAKPDRASVEFGIELEKKDGDIFSKICNVGGKGSLKIKLEWDFNKNA